ncbi:hypothetical protein JCM3770_004187 [Rhodotorula araucariae]
MTSQDPQPCLVRGEKTMNRCSNCKNAGIDLFFCSPEHQKLVWPVHKLVCGPGKANPFLWPKLTAKEAEDAVQHKDVCIRNGISISELLQKQRVRPAMVADNIKSLCDHPSSLVFPGHYRDQLTIASIRFSELMRNFQPEKTPGEPEFVVKVLRSMTAWTARLDFDFILSSQSPIGRTPFLHRVLICCALTYLPRETAPRALCLTAWDQVQACFDHDLQVSNRAEAEKVMQTVGVEAVLVAGMW